MNPPRDVPAGAGNTGPTASRAWQAVEWLALLVLAGYAARWLLVPGNGPRQYDFHTYFYPAGQAMAHRTSPYDFRSPSSGLGFVYPPHLAVLLAPLGMLPEGLAAGLWEILNLALLLASVGLSERLCGLELGWRRRVITTLSLLLWAPVATHVILGSCTLIVTASLGGALLALRQGRTGLGGFLLAIAAVKPQLVFLLGAGLVVREWRLERSARLLVAGIASVAGVTLVAYGVAPDWPASLLSGQKEVYDYWGVTTNLRTLLAAPAGPNVVTESLFAAGFVATCAWILWLWSRPSADPVVLAGLTITVTLLATPYAQGYDYVVLVLPFLLVMHRIAAAVPSRRPWLFVALVLGTWIAGSLDQRIHNALAWKGVWSTLTDWFGKRWVEAAWEQTRWNFRFLVMMVPLFLTVALRRWPPGLGSAPDSARTSPSRQTHG